MFLFFADLKCINLDLNVEIKIKESIKTDNALGNLLELYQIVTFQKYQYQYQSIYMICVDPALLTRHPKNVYSFTEKSTLSCSLKLKMKTALLGLAILLLLSVVRTFIIC